MRAPEFSSRTPRSSTSPDVFTGNVGLGVDLAPAGHNTNDAGDADSGPNEGLNYPVITSAVSDGVSPSSRIQGTIHSKPNAQIQVLLYLNAVVQCVGIRRGGTIPRLGPAT